MYEGLVKAFEKLENISLTLLITLCSGLGLLIFLPSDVAKRLSVLQFREKYSVFLGPVFLLFVAFLIARVVNELRRKHAGRRAAQNRRDQLEKLTPEEKAYLREFIMDERNTIRVGIDDGVMGGLVAKKICYMSSNVFDLLEGASYNLQPWAREQLAAKPELLDGARGAPMTPRQKMRLDGW